MPGIGVRTGARILTEVGDATSFATAHLASYVGLTPVTRRSGSSIRGEASSLCWPAPPDKKDMPSTAGCADQLDEPHRGTPETVLELADGAGVDEFASRVLAAGRVSRHDRARRGASATSHATPQPP